MARRGHHTLEQIKDMVLLAAEDLVVEGGLANLKVRNVALKIGYTVGSIYMVFANMDELILHVKGRTLDDLYEQMEQVQCSDCEQCLEKLAAAYINFASQNYNRWSAVFDHRLPEGMAIPSWYQHKLDKINKLFEAQLVLLNPRASSITRRQLALALLGGIHGICVFMLSTQLGGLQGNDLSESVVLLVKQFVRDAWANSTVAITPTHDAKPAALAVNA